MKTLGQIAYEASPEGWQQNWGPWDKAPGVVRRVHNELADAVANEVARRSVEGTNEQLAAALAYTDITDASILSRAICEALSRLLCPQNRYGRRPQGEWPHNIIEQLRDSLDSARGARNQLRRQLEELMSALKDPAAVWTNMLRGTIARPQALDHYEELKGYVERISPLMEKLEQRSRVIDYINEHGESADMETILRMAREANAT